MAGTDSKTGISGFASELERLDLESIGTDVHVNLNRNLLLTPTKLGLLGCWTVH